MIDLFNQKLYIHVLNFLLNNDSLINEKKAINNSVESTYYLSEAGLKLLPIMETMISWSNKNLSCDK